MPTYVYEEGYELYRFIYYHRGAHFFPEAEHVLLEALNAAYKRYMTDCDFEQKNSDPEVVRKIGELVRHLMQLSSEAAIRDHREKLAIPRCRRCAAVLRTPLARQCISCGHSWFRAA